MGCPLPLENPLPSEQCDALKPAALLLGGVEVTGRIAVAAHSVEIRDAAFAHGGLPLRVGLHTLVDSLDLIRDQNRLDALDFLPRDQLLAGNVHHGLERLPPLLDDGQRFTAERHAWFPAQNFGFRRLVQVDAGIAAGGIEFARRLQGFEDRPILLRSESVQRMPRGLGMEWDEKDK